NSEGRVRRGRSAIPTPRRPKRRPSRSGCLGPTDEEIPDNENKHQSRNDRRQPIENAPRGELYWSKPSSVARRQNECPSFLDANAKPGERSRSSTTSASSKKYDGADGVLSDVRRRNFGMSNESRLTVEDCRHLCDCLNCLASTFSRPRGVFSL